MFSYPKILGNVIMKRKIYDRLVQRTQGKNGFTALLIEGARRIEKSYIAEIEGSILYLIHFDILFILCLCVEAEGFLDNYYLYYPY